MTPQRHNRVKVTALLHAKHKVSDIANFVGVSRTTVYSIKKCMNEGEGINRRAGSGRKTVVDRGSLQDVSKPPPEVHMRTNKETWGWSGDCATNCR